ncbi:MAG: hypothetical protein HDT28_06830 [Clostridiales bacterium]|nr:hypothetical protein [Clostridiales bacterium]
MDSKTDKFVSMIGFAKRAGKIVYGYDNLKSSRGVKLLAVSGTASVNLADGMKRLAEQKRIPLVMAAALEEVVGNNVKALGLTDGNMASAVVQFVSNDESVQYKLENGLRR